MDRVKYLLERYPELRDDDFKLISTFYYNEAGGEKTKNMSAYDFIINLGNGKYTHSESIRRCRAKLQENNIELRGNNYDKRKEEGRETSKQIKNL